MMHDCAILAFERVLELDETCVMTYINKGNSYMALTDYEKAINCFDTYLFYDEDNSVIWNTKGVCHKNLMQEELAVKAFGKAIECDSTYTEA